MEESAASGLKWGNSEPTREAGVGWGRGNDCFPRCFEHGGTARDRSPVPGVCRQHEIDAFA
eukprot:scaffold35309_cov30-Tisochrysis_lutea.AAC.1